MLDRIEPHQHVRYVEVKLPGRRQRLTYHTHDLDIQEGDNVDVCSGLLEGYTGYVTAVDVGPPVRALSGRPLYTYRVEKVREPSVEHVILVMADDSRLSLPVDQLRSVTTGGVRVSVERA
jgi:hypothetical protein